MIFINLSISLLLPVFLGYGVLQNLFVRNPLERSFNIALSYGLGMGIVSHWLLVLSLLNIPYTKMNLNIPLFALGTVLLLIYKRNYASLTNTTNTYKIKKKVTSDKHDLYLNIIMICYMLFNIFFVFWSALNIPITEWDALSTHAFNAKIIYHNQSLSLQKNFPHATYPLHIPLLLSWISFQLQSWNDQLIKIIFPSTFLSYLICQYYFLKEFVNRKWAFLGLVLFVSSNLVTYHATTAYRDFTMLYYNCFTIMFLLLWSKSQYRSWIYLAAIFSGFCSFVKLEGTGYIFIHFLILLIILHYKKSNLKNRIIKSAQFLIPSMGICGFYHLYKYFSFTAKLRPADSAHQDYNFNLTHLILEYSPEQLNNIPIILFKFLNNLLFSGNWNIVWFIFILSLFCLKESLYKMEGKILLWSLALFFGIYFFGYCFTQHAYWVIEGETVLSRSILHFYPLACIFLILSFQKRKSHVQ